MGLLQFLSLCRATGNCQLSATIGPYSLQANIHHEAPKHPLSPSQHGLGTVWKKGSAAPVPASCSFYQHFHPPFLLGYLLSPEISSSPLPQAHLACPPPFPYGRSDPQGCSRSGLSRSRASGSVSSCCRQPVTHHAVGQTHQTSLAPSSTGPSHTRASWVGWHGSCFAVTGQEVLSGL